MMSNDTVWKKLSALEFVANWRKQKKNSIQNYPNYRKAVPQKLKTPPKTIAQSFDNVAKSWQNSEHMQR